MDLSSPKLYKGNLHNVLHIVQALRGWSIIHWSSVLWVPVSWPFPSTLGITHFCLECTFKILFLCMWKCLSLAKWKIGKVKTKLIHKLLPLTRYFRNQLGLNHRWMIVNRSRQNLPLKISCLWLTFYCSQRDTHSLIITSWRLIPSQAQSWGKHFLLIITQKNALGFIIAN